MVSAVLARLARKARAMIANIHQAKTDLSKLIEAAERGKEVIIARAGKPVVRLSLPRAA